MDSPEGYHCLLCYHQVPFDFSPAASLPADFDTNYFLFNFLSIPPSTDIDFEELGPSLCHNYVVNLMAITRMLKRIDELRLQFKENLTKAFEESEKTLDLDHFEDKFCNLRAALLRDINLVPAANIKVETLPHPDLGAFEQEMREFPSLDSSPAHQNDPTLEEDDALSHPMVGGSFQLKELIIPIERLNLPLGETSFNLKDLAKIINLPILPPRTKPNKSTSNEPKLLRIKTKHNQVYFRKKEPESAQTLHCYICGFKTRFEGRMKTHERRVHLRAEYSGISKAERKRMNNNKNRIINPSPEEILAKNLVLIRTKTNQVYYRAREPKLPQPIHCTLPSRSDPTLDCGFSTQLEGRMKFHLKTSHGQETVSKWARKTPRKKVGKSANAPEDGTISIVKTKHNQTYFRSKETPLPHLIQCTYPSRSNPEERCNYQTQVEGNLKRHISAAHVKNEPYLEANQTQESLLECKYCGLARKTVQELEIHEMVHTGEKPFICEVCGKGFRVESRLMNHLNVHKDPETLPKCQVCNKRFASQSHLRAHSRTHRRDSWLQCDLCGRSFQNKIALEGHMGKEHSIGTPSACPYPNCNKVFTIKYSLQKHIKAVHKPHGEREFQCSQCPKGFVIAYLLKKHMEWAHSGGRIQCKLCEKTYLSDVSLHAHMQIHSQKKHLCPICGQSFLRKEVLTKHQKAHDKTKKFFCEKCGAGFHMRGNLSQHLRMKKCRNDEKD